MRMRWFDVENREMAILKELEQGQWVSCEGLADRLGVSAKTVQNDIRQMNGSLGEWATIEGRHRMYKLYIMDEGRYRRIRNDIEKQNNCFEQPQMRMSFIIDTLMNSDQPYLIDELAYAMSIGRSTIVSDLKKLKEILGFYGLAIVGKTNSGISLAGEELNLRLFILENNFKVIYDEGALDEDLVELVKEQTRSWRMDAMAITSFLQFLTLTLDRVLNNHGLKEMAEKYLELLDNSCYSMVCAIVDGIEEKLHLQISQKERIFLTIPFAGMRTPYDISGVESALAMDTKILDMMDAIMGRIHQDMGLTIATGSDRIIEEFAYHLYFMGNRLRYGLRLHNPMVDSMKKKFGVAYRMALVAKDVIEEQMNISLPEDEVAFLAAYFEVFLSGIEAGVSERYRVAVVCGSGRATARLTLKQLGRVLGSDAELTLCNDDSALESEVLDTFDLVVSTVGGSFETTTPVIQIDAVFDEDALQKNIDRIRHMEKLDIPLIRGVESVLLSLLDESTFFVLDPRKDYMESVHTMIDALEAKGLVDADFGRRIDIRESKSTMVFDETVAFPHGYQKAQDKSVVAVGVFPEAMAAGVHPELKVIFLVALSEAKEDDTVLVQIYDEIIALSSNPGVPEQLAKRQSYQDFLMYFIRDCDLFG